MFAELITPEQLTILGQIIFIDLVLAGDNAIIIGMVASKFPVEQRKKVIFWGIGGAVILRIILTMLTAYLLQITGLRLIGGLLLLYIIYKLYTDVIKGQSNEEDIKVDNSSFMKAIWTVLLADFTMSLDNVLGVAGAAGDHYGLLIFGLALSIVLMATAANLISRWIKEYKWIAWAGLLAILTQIIFIDLVLAGDNAIIIGMVASKFPVEQRKKVIFWGIGGAVILRIILTMLTAYLLQITGLRLVGGLLLLYIVYKLYTDVIKGQSDEEDVKVDNSSFMKAIWTVLLADFTMSLDNVLGVAGAAGDHYVLLIFGLALSIILMATAANLISGWIKKYKWIAWAGLLAILVVAVELIYTDIKILFL